MAKYILKEGVIEQFMSAIFDSIIHHRQEKVRNALEKDPDLQKMYGDIDTTVQRMRAHFAKQPSNAGIDYQELIKKLDNLLY